MSNSGRARIDLPRKRAKGVGPGVKPPTALPPRTSAPTGDSPPAGVAAERLTVGYTVRSIEPYRLEGHEWASGYAIDGYPDATVRRFKVAVWKLPSDARRWRRLRNVAEGRSADRTRWRICRLTVAWPL